MPENTDPLEGQLPSPKIKYYDITGTKSFPLAQNGKQEAEADQGREERR